MNTYYPIYDNNNQLVEHPTLKYTLAEGLPDDWFQAPANADAGYDLRAYCPDVDTETIQAYELYSNNYQCKLHTGIYIDIPCGYVGIIKDRSSLAIDKLTVCGGVIDSGYTGEIIVLLRNYDTVIRRRICHGDKIAQLVIVPILTLPVEKVDSLEQTERGGNGFGSTGR